MDSQVCGTFSTGNGAETAVLGYYTSFIAGLDPVFWMIIFVLLTGVVVLFGVRNGVGRACKVLMPIEVVLLVILAAYCLTLPNALEGMHYYLYPDFFQCERGGNSRGSWAGILFSVPGIRDYADVRVIPE